MEEITYLSTINLCAVNGELLVLFSTAGALLGLLAGVLLAHPRLVRALRAGVGALNRTRAKAMTLPPVAARHDVFRMPHLDWVESIPNVTLKADPQAIDAVVRFRGRLMRHYGDEIVTVFLFGSRARGDHLTTSDVDLAVLFSPRVRIGLWTHWTMWRIAFEVLLDAGLYLQPRPLQLDSPMNACLVPTIAREGLRVSVDHQIEES